MVFSAGFGPRGSHGDETELNLTPMIDVVFQLIVFFLLSLKFKTVDRRFESRLPNDRGERESFHMPEELPLISVKLFKETADTPEASFTQVRVGNRSTIRLPPPGHEARADAAGALCREIEAVWAARGHDAEVKGEIKTPRPKGQLVTHGDVMLVLDAFLRVGIGDVVFEGDPGPLPGG